MAENYETIENIVHLILETYPESRESDWMLFFYVCKFVNPIVLGMQMGNVLKNANEYDLENFGTITRARRKLMRKYPELKASKKTRSYRRKRYKEAREYAFKV